MYSGFIYNGTTKYRIIYRLVFIIHNKAHGPKWKKGDNPVVSQINNAHHTYVYLAMKRHKLCNLLFVLIVINEGLSRK